ncbi:MAG: PLP-dependent transferase [Lachnospiraceae bacterium]|nr:PLP-dependent transferase [Lachnospiraceae bacterium]
MENYSKENIYPMHMPGHKRNTKIMNMADPYSIDITEIDGFDNMHAPEGVIKDIMDRAANLWGSRQCFISVNGTTAGILSAISACCKRRKSIIVARNCHKSVYNAVYLNELNPAYVYPRIDKHGIAGEIKLEDVQKVVESLIVKGEIIGAMVITSPTYEGVISDIRSISDYLHKYNIPLIVDGAHGAHIGLFGFYDTYNTILQGADIVVHSIHKTLPALTQTSLVHVTFGSIVDGKKVQKYMAMYQSSSPSYVLMSGIDKCISTLEKYGKELFRNYYSNLASFYERCKKLKVIEVLDSTSVDAYGYDMGKIVITSGRFGMGNYIYTMLLNHYKIQAELKSYDYVIAMTSICDTPLGFERLYKALFEIDRVLEKQHFEEEEAGNNSGRSHSSDEKISYYDETGIERTIDKLEVKTESDIQDDYDYEQSIAEAEREIQEYIKQQEEKNKMIESVSYNLIDENNYSLEVFHNDASYSSVFNNASRLERRYNIFKADNMEKIDIMLEDAIGHVCGDYIYIFPPGVPLIVPGEVFSKDVVTVARLYLAEGFNVSGVNKGIVKIVE